ncbi:unnamed protein product [Laminaria digitata]
MSALDVNVLGTRVAAADSEERVPVSEILGGINEFLRRWKAARHEGQGVLTGLSNAILLRTHIDSGRAPSSGSGGGGGNISGSSAVWGVLANAGTALSRVSIATEARVRQLHSELSALQDAMLAAAAGIRRHALEARRRCQTIPTAGHPMRGGNVAADTVAAAPAGAVVAVEGKVKSVNNESSDDSVAVGGGYGLVDVADAASEVAEMLLKEALVTATVAQGVGKCQDDREALTAYAAAWMMQPYVDARRVKELEAMVAGPGGGRARP